MDRQRIIGKVGIWIVALVSGLAQQPSDVLPKIQAQIPDVFQQLREIGQLAPGIADGTVDPDRYIVGTGDIFLLQITGPLSIQSTLIVAPDGTLLLPRLSPLRVAGKSLATVTDHVQQQYRRWNPSLKVSLSLLKPRQVLVSIDGDVMIAGDYLFPANLRVATAVQLVQMFGQLQLQQQRSQSAKLLQLKYRWQQQQLAHHTGGLRILPYTERYLVVLRRGGEVLSVDPLRGRIDSTVAEPLVQEGDRIVVPFAPKYYPQVGVIGDVPLPCLFPYRSGDHLAFALRVAAVDSLIQGTRITLTYNDGNVQTYVYRRSDDWSTFERILLSPGSTISVQLPQDTLPSPAMVAVIGAVPSPGLFALDRGHRLSTVLRRAGVSRIAINQQGYVIRQSAFNSYDPAELYEVVHLLRAFPAERFDTAHYRIDVLTRRAIIACDLRQALENPGSDHDIILQAGDIVVVREPEPLVYVFGQVQTAGFVPFQEGRSVQWYLEQAGGLNAMADESAIQVWKSSTGGWINAEEAVVEAGDQIYVPRQTVLSSAERMQMFSVILGIASSAAFLISTVINLLSR